MGTGPPPGAGAPSDPLRPRPLVTAVMRQIVLPYLAELGDRWERGDASIAQAHFASNLIRSAGRAGTRLGRRERPAGHPGLPARGVARPGPNDLRRHPEPPRVADRLPRRGHAGRGTPLVPAACCRPFMTERSPAGGRLHLLAAPVFARPQEPRAALVQQLTHPAPPACGLHGGISRDRFEAVTRGRR